MTPLPGGLGGTELLFWRLDSETHKATWDSGEGARRAGGRWNSGGTAAVYSSVDPATAIVEVAVHKGFRVLDTMPHVLTWARIIDPSTVHVVTPAEIPNLNWLRPCTPSAGQQRFGDTALGAHPFVLIPSAVSTYSWNLLFNPANAVGRYEVVGQERFALDPRLHKHWP